MDVILHVNLLIQRLKKIKRVIKKVLKKIKRVIKKVLIKILILLIKYFYSYIILYFNFFFNILYYKIQYFNLSIYKLYYKMINYSGSGSNFKILLYFNVFLFLNIFFFYLFYIQYILKLGEIFFLKRVQSFNIYILFILDYHYRFLSHVNILNYNSYKKIKVGKNKLFVEQYILNFLISNILYLNFFFSYLYKLINYYYLGLYTILIRFYRLVKNNEKYKIKFFVKECQKFLFLKINTGKANNVEALENKKFGKKKFYIKRVKTVKYGYTKCKRIFIKYYLNYKMEYQNVNNERFEILLLILYDIHKFLVQYSGYLIFYYIFLMFKYIKSYIFYIGKSDKIYNFFKKIERKKG